MISRLALPALLLVLAFLSTATAADAPAPRPNILLMIADDWNWNHAGAYGCTWVKTPTFDRVAREGALFNHCFTSNPKCSPCRASILTGRNTWQLEEASCHNGLFPHNWPAYPELLQKAGYHVGQSGKGWGPGDWKTGGWPHNPAGPEYQSHKLTPPLKGMGNVDLAANFAEFLGQRQSGQPFCFWAGSNEPHRGYELDSGMRAGKPLEEVAVPRYLPDHPVVRSDLLDYCMEVEWLDKQFGRVLEVLEKSGELDNTIVLITSDHGMPFPRVKGQIYDDGFHLPLAIRWGSAVKPGRVVDDFVNVRDFAPTFLAVAGVEIPATVTGRNLLELLRSEKSGWVDPKQNVMLAGKERHDLGRPFDWGYPVRAIRTPEYLYSYNYYPERWPAGNPETDFGNCDGSPSKELLKAILGHFYDLSFGRRPQRELYRLSDDPDCVRNLAGDPYFAPVMADLHERMFAALRADGDPRALGNGAIFDTYQNTGSNRGKAYDTWLNAQQFTPQEAAPRPRRNATK